MMKPPIKTVALLWGAILLLCFSKQSTAQSSNPEFDPVLAAQLQLVLNEELSAQRLKGLSAAAIIPGQGMWQGVSGLSGPTSSDVMRPDIRFGIASIKKTFVAALILKLAEEGALSLDDPLGQWLPYYRYIHPWITLRQLLSHTSGVYNYTEHPSFWNTLSANVAKVWMPEEVLNTFVSIPPFAAGSRFEYSNTNYLLLSMVIEVASGSSVSTHYRDRFWGPLNFEGTFLGAEEGVTGEIAHNWTDHDGDGQLEDINYMVGPSMYTMLWPFVFSTAEDIARWAEALYGGQILEAASLDEMLDFTPINDVVWTGYGLGAMRMVLQGEEVWGHAGLIPGYRSLMVYWPRTGVSISLLGNQDGFSIYTIVSRLIEAVKDFQAMDTAIATDSEGPGNVGVHPNYPNPFRQSTRIAFDLPRAETVTIEVFDLYGRKLATLADGAYGPGSHSVRWQARGLASGVYLYRLQAGTYSAVETMSLVR